MQGADLGAADGSIGIDFLWKRRLGKLLSETPLPASLLEAVQSLAAASGFIDIDDLEAIIVGKSQEWAIILYADVGDGGFGLPRSYRVDFAVAIYVYSLQDPPVYSVVNKEMFNPARRKPQAQGGGGISDGLRSCMPYIKYLDSALEALPASYLFQGRVQRGVQWAYPSPDAHDPEGYFAVGASVMWYEFKSTSERMEVMTRPHFCGVEPGPRTIFTVHACRGHSIKKFSFFQGAESEYEVLFRPLSQFVVMHSQKNLIDPKEKHSLERSGFPDAIVLRQVDDGQPQPAPPAAAPTPAPTAAGPAGAQPAPAAAPQPAPTSAAPGRAVSGSSDKTLRVWDLGTGACERTLSGHSSHVWCVALA